MKYQYIDLKKTANQIAVECEVSGVFIAGKLKKFKIPIRPRIKTGSFDNKKYLLREYINQEKTMTDIARNCGTSIEVIRRRLKNFNIPIRIQYLGGLYRNKKYLEKRYVKEERSMDFMAKECGCKINAIRDWLIKYNIPRRNGIDIYTKAVRLKMSKAKEGIFDGENNPNWKDGSSFIPYCIKYNKKSKERARNKYRRVCIICEKPIFQNLTKNKKVHGRLDTHHIDANKQQGCDGVKWKLVSLCHIHHGQMNNTQNHMLLQLLLINNNKGELLMMFKGK